MNVIENAKWAFKKLFEKPIEQELENADVIQYYNMQYPNTLKRK